MKILKIFPRISLALAAAVALAHASPAWAQVDLTRIAWVGDSIGAGYSAGCLTKRVQVDSIGAVHRAHERSRLPAAHHQRPGARRLHDPDVARTVVRP